MKTKHLFSAALLTALFAACSNEEFVSPTAPKAENDGRPMVENVKLNFNKENDGDSNTRVIFDPATGLYSWVDGDKVGALLMDVIDGTSNNYRPYSDAEEWAKLSWFEKYKLDNYIHTDYPFIYDKANGTWNSNAAMLEGNYFFVSPYEGYNSKRQLIHSIAGQTQKDGTLDATAEAFGKNQYWIGYSQIKEGNKTSEALANVEMTRVLAPIRFEIKMIGTQTYTVNKITIQGDDVRTLLTIDPTCAFDVPSGSVSPGYKGENGAGDYNLQDGSGSKTTRFNYANYLSEWDPAMQDEVYDHAKAVTAADNRVFNIEDPANYDRFNALRAIVDVESVKTDEVQYAELSYETEQTLSKNAAVVNGVIFVNPDLEVASGKLKMSIYTNQGVIKDIDLTVVNTEIEKAAGKTTVITDKAIKVLTPSTQNLIKIQVDDNSIDVADVLTVNNDNDLKQFIDWNKSKNRPYVAMLANNATLTKDMVETLRVAKEANADNKLIVATDSDRKLIIAADAAADALDFVCLDGVTFDINHDGTPDNIGSIDVEVLGTINLDSKTAIALPDGTSKQITIAKGATLNIIEANTNKLLIIENNGTIEMAADADAKNIKVINNEKATMEVAGSLQFASGSENNGTINVAATGVLQGTTGGNFTNKGLIKNLGKIWNIINDDVETAIVETSALTNHFQSNATDATIKLIRLGDPVTITTANNGHILYDGENVNMKDATAAEVTDLIVSGYLRADGDATTATVKTITVEEGESITIEGGTYIGSVWTLSAQQLNVVASGAVLNLSGTVTMNNLSDAVKADVNVLKGSLSIDKGTVAAVNNLTLGSKEGFTEYGATINVAKGTTLTIAATLARDTEVSKTKPIINNNGTVTAVTKTDVTNGNIVVNGNAI